MHFKPILFKDQLYFYLLDHCSQLGLYASWDWGGDKLHDRWGWVAALLGWDPEARVRGRQTLQYLFPNFPSGIVPSQNLPPYSDHSLPCQVNLKPTSTHMQAQPCCSLGNSKINSEVQVLTTDEAPPTHLPAPRHSHLTVLSEELDGILHWGKTRAAAELGSSRCPWSYQVCAASGDWGWGWSQRSGKHHLRA